MKQIVTLILGLLICSTAFGQSTAIPVITPPPGTYNNNVSVTITDGTPGATIFYTTDGSTPTTNSNKYTGPFTVSANATVQAIAFVPGSSVAMSAFAITQCAKSGTAWKSLPFAIAQTGNFQIDFDATPSAVNIDSVLGISSAAVTAYAQLSMGVRFRTTGDIDAISGAGYTPAQTIPYVVGQKYHFSLTVAGSTYSASVDGKLIGANLPFRAAATTFAQMSYVAEIGSVNICNLKLSAYTPPAPALPLVFVTTTLPAAKYGVAYSTILTAGGGKAPYTWSATGTGLPTGMSLSATGILSGTPYVSGTFPVTASDAAQKTVTENLTLTVSPKPTNSVNLTWNAAANTTGYNVYRATVKLPGMPVAGTTFTDSSVTAGASYCYTVTSVGGTSTVPLESAPSSQVCVTIPTS